MEFKMIKPDELAPNEYNPNEMIDSVYQHLKREIHRVGFIVPVIARRTPNGLVLIDGEHRWRAAREMRLEQIPVIILEMGEEEAKLQTINTNLIKGEFNPIKFAELLKDLTITYNEDQLKDFLNMSKQEVDAHLMLLELDDEEKRQFARQMKDTPTLNEVKLIYTDQQYEVFMKAVQHTGISNTSDAVLAIVKEYLTENQIPYEEEVTVKGEEE